jgi:hypothetical protein
VVIAILSTSRVSYVSGQFLVTSSLDTDFVVRNKMMTMMMMISTILRPICFRSTHNATVRRRTNGILFRWT